MHRKRLWVYALLATMCVATHPPALAQASRYEALARIPLRRGYLSERDLALLKDELLFQRAVQSYLWALPAISLYAMKEGSEKAFGKGYHVLPVFRQRLSAKTLLLTPSFDVISGMSYLDLKETGPTVLEVPPGLHGILNDFFQRPICSVEPLEGRTWCGDVGPAGPDHGHGGKYLLLPPDHHGTIPHGYLAMRSRTYGVFVSWRAFFKDPNATVEPIRLIESTRIYPLGAQRDARPMQFPDAALTPVNLLYPQDGSAFDLLARFIQHEYVEPDDFDMRGMLASIGIVKGRPFTPDGRMRTLLNQAAGVAFRITRALAFEPSVPKKRWYHDRQWLHPFPGNAEFRADSFTLLDPRIGYFALAFAASPDMALDVTNLGSKSPTTFKDANGDFLRGERFYRLHLPKGVPVSLFWSVTIYDPTTATGVDNGQPVPSISTMDRPQVNADGSTDIYFGPRILSGKEKNWLRTLPGRGFFVQLRLYGPTQPLFEQTWKPSDLEQFKP
jgi:hypothetical protein